MSVVWEHMIEFVNNNFIIICMKANDQPRLQSWSINACKNASNIIKYMYIICALVYPINTPP